MSLVSVITCTGFRPEALKLCQFYLERQNCGYNIEWIVVSDDPNTPELKTKKPGLFIKNFRGPRSWTPGYNTQRGNMELGLSLVTGDFIFVMEDEDYYRADYIKTMLKLLSTAPIAGEVNSKYYHLELPGFKGMKNYRHSSLCQTGIRKELIPYLMKSVTSGELYFDVHLWRTINAEGIASVLVENQNLCIGIKGMPGRAGIGAGHKKDGYLIDQNLVQLRNWIGNDADLYKEFTKYGKGKSEEGSARGLQISTKADRGRGLRQESSRSNLSIKNPIGVRFSKEKEPTAKAR